MKYVKVERDGSVSWDDYFDYIEKIKAKLPVDVYELGLIYDIQILPINNAHILMTLTSPNCPAAESIPADVKNRVEMIKEINEVDVEITFDPPYSSDLMSEEAKLELGFM